MYEQKRNMFNEKSHFKVNLTPVSLKNTLVRGTQSSLVISDFEKEINSVPVLADYKLEDIMDYLSLKEFVCIVQGYLRGLDCSGSFQKLY